MSSSLNEGPFSKVLCNGGAVLYWGPLWDPKLENYSSGVTFLWAGGFSKTVADDLKGSVFADLVLFSGSLRSQLALEFCWYSGKRKADPKQC